MYGLLEIITCKEATTPCRKKTIEQTDSDNMTWYNKTPFDSNGDYSSHIELLRSLNNTL